MEFTASESAALSEMAKDPVAEQPVSQVSLDAEKPQASRILTPPEKIGETAEPEAAPTLNVPRFSHSAPWEGPADEVSSVENTEAKLRSRKHAAAVAKSAREVASTEFKIRLKPQPKIHPKAAAHRR